MDSTAVNSIADLAVLAIKQVEGAVVLPERHKLESTERFNNVPKHFRAKFSTNIISQFIGYINNNATAESQVFIDQDAMTAKAIIDIGSKEYPEWGYHRASVGLKKTPPYAALLDNNTSQMDQQHLINFCTDWENNIVFQDAEGRAIPMQAAIKLLRRLKVQTKQELENTVHNFGASRSALEQIEVTAGAEEIPPSFMFHCNPYDSFNTKLFHCELRATSTEKEVRLKFRIAGLDAIKEEIGDEFKDKILEETEVDELTIYLGELSYQ